MAGPRGPKKASDEPERGRGRWPSWGPWASNPRPSVTPPGSPSTMIQRRGGSPSLGSPPSGGRTSSHGEHHEDRARSCLGEPDRISPFGDPEPRTPPQPPPTPPPPADPPVAC